MARGDFLVGYPYGGMGMGMMGSKSASHVRDSDWEESRQKADLAVGIVVNPYGYGGMPY